VLGSAEARTIAMAGIALLVLALLAAVWPRVIAVPLAAIAMWLAGHPCSSGRGSFTVSG